jgi:hypothetical protein
MQGERIVQALALAACVLLASLGCPPATHYASGEGATVTIVNRTDETICHLRASRCDLNPPGSQDVLQGAGELPAGDTLAASLPTGCWNLKAEDCSLAFVTGVAGVVVEESGTTVELTP